MTALGGDNKVGSAGVSRWRTTSLKYQALITAALFFGLFFIEYPPLFALGYWSWGFWGHKTLSGVFIILNLVVTQYAVRRWGFFRRTGKAEPEKADGATGQP